LRINYERNSLSQPWRTTYYSGFGSTADLATYKNYDSYGYFDNISSYSTANGTSDITTIWRRTANTGTQTTAKLGGTIDLTKNYDSKGFLTEHKTVIGNTEILKMNYTFSPTTGNLTYRAGMNGTEDFYYDNLDRLTDTYVMYHPNQSSPINLGTEYSANGNIQTPRHNRNSLSK
jgi:hypothetical protein